MNGLKLVRDSLLLILELNKTKPDLGHPDLVRLAPKTEQQINSAILTINRIMRAVS